MLETTHCVEIVVNSLAISTEVKKKGLIYVTHFNVGELDSGVALTI